VEGVQRPSVDELADQHCAAALLAELVQGHDPRVIQASDGLGLAQDAIGVGRGDLLDRDLALEALVEGAVDGSHAPRADPVEEPESLHHELVGDHVQILRRARLRSCPRPRSFGL
jgi:hypothetical protein